MKTPFGPDTMVAIEPFASRKPVSVAFTPRDSDARQRGGDADGDPLLSAEGANAGRQPKMVRIVASAQVPPAMATYLARRV